MKLNRIKNILVALLIATAVISNIPGCKSPLLDKYEWSDDKYTVTQDKLRNIEQFDPFEHAIQTQTLAEVESQLDPGNPEFRHDINTNDNEPQSEVSLSLEECRAYALDYNLDLQVQLLSPTITQESINEEEARFESLFYTNLRKSKTDTPVADSLSGSQVDSFSGDMGVRVPLHTGGSLTFDFPFSRFETDNDFYNSGATKTTDFSISISHPLLKNAGRRTNEHGIRLANYRTKQSEALTKLEVIRVLAAVDRVYWQLYAARQALEVRKQEYDLAVTQLERAQRMVRAGSMAEVEIIRAQSGVAERLEAIIIAENSLRDRQRDLKRILNKPNLGMESKTIIIPTTEPNPIHFVLDANVLADSSVENRMEMLNLEFQLAQNSSSIDYAKNQLLPLVTIDYTYNVNGLGTSWGDSLDLLTNKSYEDHTIGLRVEIPFGNESAKSRYRTAMLNKIQTIATKKQRESQIKQEVYNAVDQLEANWQRVLASRQTALLAARNRDAELRQFELGIRTSTDVLDAQARLAAAQLAEIRALAEYQIVQVDIAYATGTLLGATHVKWEPAEPELNISYKN